MRSKILVAGIFAVLAMAASVSAADISGKWTAQAAGVELTLVLKVDGNAVTGTLNNPQAGEAELKEGKIEGDNISFYVMRKIGESDTKVVWKGKITGADEIKFTREIAGGAGGPGGGATEVIAKRIK